MQPNLARLLKDSRKTDSLRAAKSAESHLSFGAALAAFALLNPAWLLLPGLFWTTSLFAQIGGGSIIGYVSDASKAIIPGAQVKATDVATNVTTSTVTNQSGYYEFPLLPAGQYFVEASHEGFRPARSANFTLSTSTQPRVDLTMEVGSTTSTVEVTAQAPLVNAATADLGQVVGSGKVEELPLNGRNWQQLVNLQAGATAVSGANAVLSRGGMMFNGSPGYGNQLLLDGVDMTFGEITSAPTNQAGGAGTSLIGGVSIGAISEVKVNSSSFSAEYGAAAGGVVNITAKSGTNQFHGEAFEYLRNDALDATDFFSNKNKLGKPPLRWNQFGGNLGGPILKNRLFFFFNYEGAREHTTTQISGNVPTPLLTSQLSPALQQNVAGLPQNYTPTSNPLLGFTIRNATTIDNENTTLSHVDYNFGNQRLSVRYSYNWSNYQIPQFRPANIQSAPYKFNNVSVDHTDSITPTLLNEFRFGFNRNDMNRHNSTLGVLPGDFTVSSIGLVSDVESQIHYITDTFTIADNFTIIRGAHTIKVGFQILDLDSTRFQNTGLQTYYNTPQDLIAGNVNYITVTFGSPKALASWHSGFYGQDEWRVSRQLMVTAGLRYEHFTPLKGAFNVSNANPFGPFIQKGQSMFAGNNLDFAPRLGVVWDPTGRQRLVVRAGGGITYMPAQPMLFYDFNFISPLIPFSANIAQSGAPANFSLAFPFPEVSFVQEVEANPGVLNTLGVSLGRNVADYNAKDSYAGQWNFSVQGAVTSNLAVQASYVGNRANHLWVPTYPNQFLPHNGPRPAPSYGAVTFICNCASSNYNALQLSLNEKNFHGLILDAYYTYAKNLSYGVANDTNNIGNNASQDVYNLRGSYGPVDGDTRQVFVLNHAYMLPTPGFARQSAFGKAALGGWSYDGIMTIRSGLALNALAGLDLVRNQRPTGDRPNLVSGANPYIRNYNTLQYLNPAAFDAQTPYSLQQYGNLGYNALYGPGGFSYDAALHKIFRITERHSITFRAEAFNVVNHVVFNNPVNTVTSPQFGQITGGSAGRAFQFALTYAF